jgi:hypothetical protein
MIPPPMTMTLASEGSEVFVEKEDEEEEEDLLLL